MKEIKGVIYCHSCQTDLREKNKDLHADMRHKIVIYKHDPRDKRYPVEPIIS